MLEPIPFAGYVEIPDELTDEEISWFAKAYTDQKGKLHIIYFARAIQRNGHKTLALM